MRRPRHGATARGDRGLSVLGLALIGVAFLVLGGLGAAAFMLRPPPTDAETLCRTDAPIRAHTIVLVDSTDRLEPRHRRKLRAVLAQERARLSQYDRLTIMRLNVRRPQEPARLFSRCLPRPPEQTNPLFENARVNQQRWDDEFESVLSAATRSAQAGGTQRASPILASLRAIAADPDFGAEISTRRLVIVSDLLEHDPTGFSLYVSDANYAQWRAASAFGPPDLTRVDARLAPLDRPEHADRQAAALREFWPAFFGAADVHSFSIDPAP
jgi:hypothetical protein